MRIAAKLATIVTFGLLLQSCAQFVRGTVTSFYVPEYRANGSIAVMASDKAVDQSLEFQYYKKKIEQRLVASGYRIATPSTADQIALAVYGIDTGKTSVVSTPIFGQTGGGTSYQSGTVYGSSGSASYSGTSYSMPTYGVVGSVESSRTIYKRAIAIDIVNLGKKKPDAIRTVYQGRVVSQGKCEAISEVFDAMLDIMFKNFPGESGKSKTFSVDGHYDC